MRSACLAMRRARSALLIFDPPEDEEDARRRDGFDAIARRAPSEEAGEGVVCAA